MSSSAIAQRLAFNAVIRAPRSRLASFLAISCTLVLAVKFWLIWRINVNWDEFLYLSHVHAFVRGEMTNVFQKAHVHLFAWLVDFGRDELDQILAARVVSWALLVVMVGLIGKLASRWVSPAMAWFAPLTFFAFEPVLRHSASFRSDSLIAPLILLALVALTSPRPDRLRPIVAGCALGLAIAVSLKTVLLLPMLVMAVAVRRDEGPVVPAEKFRSILVRLAWFGGVAAATAGVVLLSHWLTLPEPEPGSTQAFAVGAARRVLLDVPLLPRWDYLRMSLAADWLGWLLILGGLVAAVAARSRASVCALSLLPLLFYRNAFPYFYVVMLAPASVLVAVAVQRALDKVASPPRGTSARDRRSLLASAIAIPLIFTIALDSSELGYDRQSPQRKLIDAVHHVFEEPVAYIDHSGMIASFPKANFFMSSWGVENYVERGTSFMADAIAARRPPLLISNTPLLFPGSPQFESLLEADRELIATSYVQLWGIIMVAGAEDVVPPFAERLMTVPFPGSYRVEAETPVAIRGALMQNGDILEVREDDRRREIPVRNESNVSVPVRLVWAQSNPELPAGLAPNLPVYSPL